MEEKMINLNQVDSRSQLASRLKSMICVPFNEPSLGKKERFFLAEHCFQSIIVGTSPRLFNKENNDDHNWWLTLLHRLPLRPFQASVRLAEKRIADCCLFARPFTPIFASRIWLMIEKSNFGPAHSPLLTWRRTVPRIICIFTCLCNFDDVICKVVLAEKEEAEDDVVVQQSSSSNAGAIQ